MAFLEEIHCYECGDILDDPADVVYIPVQGSDEPFCRPCAEDREE